MTKQQQQTARQIINNSLMTLGIKHDKKVVVKALGYKSTNQLVVKRYEFTPAKELTPSEISFRLSRMQWYS